MKTIKKILRYILLNAAFVYFLVKYKRSTNKEIQQKMEVFHTEKEIYQSNINFFVNLVHEIRMTLNLIKLPLEKLSENEGANEYLNIVNKNIDYLLNVVNQLLDFQQIENQKAKLNIASMLSMPTVVMAGVTSNTDEEFITKLQTEIEKHIADTNFSIDNITDAIFMSRSNLYRKIKAISGMAPNDYLKVFRLNKAAELLENEDARISEVMEQVGFTSPSYFAKCFKVQFGMLPKEYAGKKQAEKGN